MGQDVKDHLRRALSLMFKPLVRLLIAQGVTHAEFSETAKDVYVEVALRDFEEEGRVNKSRIAILTGLTRKRGQERNRSGAVARIEGETYSRPSRVLTGWYCIRNFRGHMGFRWNCRTNRPTQKHRASCNW